MNHYETAGEECLETRSFNQIIDEDYDGSLTIFLEENGLHCSQSSISMLRNINVDPNKYPQLVEKICNICGGATAATLFPNRENTAFTRISDVPAFRILQKKFEIERYTHHQSLRSLLIQNGFLQVDVSILCNVMTKKIPLHHRKNNIITICKSLDVDPYEMFPMYIYDWGDKEPNASEIPFSDTQEEIPEPSYIPSDNELTDITGDRERLLQEVLKSVTIKQRDALYALAGFDRDHPRTLEEAACVLGYTDRRNIDQLIRSARKRIKRIQPDLWKAGKNR